MSKKVFLGVGHGGVDSGAVGLNNIYEKDINLGIALSCRTELERHGVNVLLSREKDENDGLREEIAECNQFNPALAIDIHNNAGGGDGFEVYHEVKGGVSKTLAKNIETHVKEIGQNSRGLKTKLNSYGTDWFGFVREIKAPSVLIECAFVDTKDVTIVDTAEKQKTMGIAVAKGILATLGIDYKNSHATEPPAPTGKLYKIQLGAFSVKTNADNLLKKVKDAGFKDAYIKYE